MTTEVKPVTEVYTEIASGPCIAQAASGDIFRVHIGTVAPAADTKAFYPTAHLPYPGTEKVYVRSVAGALDLIVTQVK